jgi:hypothetical protein
MSPEKVIEAYCRRWAIEDGNEHLKLTHPERLKLPHSGC